MKKFTTAILMMFVLVSSCTKDEPLNEIDESTALEFIDRVNQGDFDDSNLGLYKGVFTTKDASTRATVRIENNGKDVPVAIFKTSEGEIIQLTASEAINKGKSSGNITFSSEDASFDFSVDEKGDNITIDNVMFKGKESDILMAKQTSKAPLETVTGFYTCVDCTGHPTLGDQPETQTFNFMFSGTGEGATVMTQVTLLDKVYGSEGTDSDVTGGSGLTQTNCEEEGDFTTCNLVSGDPEDEESIALFGDSGPVYINGIHTYNNQEAGTDCSSISATMTYESVKYGTSILSIQSDEASDCEIPGPEALIFEDFEDNEVGYRLANGQDVTIGEALDRFEQNDYFGILINRDAPNVSYDGRIGEGYFGAQHTSQATPTTSNRIRLVYEDIDISDMSILEFSAFFATFDVYDGGDWDQTARAGIEYSFDGETWMKAIAIEAGPGNPDEDQDQDYVYEDLDFDTVGDVAGIQITSTFTQLRREISTEGNSTIHVRLYVRGLNNDQEDLAIDNFLLTGR